MTKFTFIHYNNVFLIILILSFLTGCGKKIFSGFFSKSTPTENAYVKDKTEQNYLPLDDGKALTKNELNALYSEGFIDKDISRHDLHDVIRHFKKYVRYDRRTIEKSLMYGGRYLPYIFEVLRKEGLPEELAYIAFIESRYDPKLMSQTGAFGIWQFTVSTAKFYGMSKNQWVDKRCDPYVSTRAAASYFKRLYKRFNDWHLVITAYNAGEARVARALSTTNSKTYFELRKKNHLLKGKARLSDEQKQYLPKFIAVCKIVRNLESLGFKPCFFKADKVVEIKVKPKTNLKEFACCIGMDWSDFFAHNAAYLKHTTPPSIYSTVYVPHHKFHQAHAVLRKKSLKGTSRGSKNKVLKDSIKKSFVFNKKDVLPLSNPQNIESKGKQKNLSYTQYIVEKGDTLYSIACKHNVSQELIARVNGLFGSKINIGQKLYIPKKNKKVEVTVSNLENTKKQKDAIKKVVRYQVQEGESLWSIARKFNISPFELLVLNDLTRDAILYPGDYIRVHEN